MQTSVELTGTSITTSQLGFGCGGLFRIPSKAGRRRVLETAFEEGIVHYDVARMYGLGMAERELGKFAKGKRDKIVIATKFGIDPSRYGVLLAPLQSGLRFLLRRSKSAKRMAIKQTTHLYQPKIFSGAEAVKSVEKSLRELKTDYLDILFLHEPSVRDHFEDSLLESLDQLHQTGKVRAFGFAGFLDDVSAVYRQLNERRWILQFPNDAFKRNHERVSIESEPWINYSPISNALRKIQEHFQQNPKQTTQATRELGFDVQSPDELANRLLDYCVQQNPQGVTLFSSSNPARITKLIRHVESKELKDCSAMETVDRLTKYIR